MENNILNESSEIFNTDKSGLELNNKGSEKVTDVKGSKTVPQVRCREKGETVTVLACCSAKETFIPCLHVQLFTWEKHLLV